MGVGKRMKLGPCTVPTKSGKPCKNTALPGKACCRWHSPSAADVAKHLEESRRGGRSRGAGAPGVFTVVPLADAIDVASFDLTTATGLRGFLAAALAHLALLPFSTTTANAIAQLAVAQRGIVDSAEIEARLSALEAAAPLGLRRA